jgi:peptidoglycan hydrolase CwlO-like protein
MSPEIPLNERVAAIEPQLEDLKSDVDDLRSFKESMIREIAELNSSIKMLSWKVSIATGVLVVTFNQTIQWALKKFLP